MYWQWVNHSRFDKTRRARWSWIMVSVTCNQVGFRHLREAFQGQKYTPITTWPALRFQCGEINLLRNDRDSDLKQIENAFKDPEERNSSEGIVGKYEAYQKFEASVVKLQLLNMIHTVAKPSDRQFYVWHLVYLDRLFLLSNLTWLRAHVTAG